MEEMRSRLGDEKKILFVVMGNDPDWNRASLPADGAVWFPNSRDASVDLCLFSRMNHTIITTGSYGWFSSLL